MAEKVSPGQRDKAAAEARTAEVGAENKQAEERRNQAREGLAQADSAADKFRQAQDVDSDLADEVALNPYPAYEDKSTDELRSAADGRGVEINRDVEKAELVKVLRAKDPANAAGLDFMTLEDLRGLAAEKGVELDDEFVRGHLVTELRAADTGVRGTGRDAR